MTQEDHMRSKTVSQIAGFASGVGLTALVAGAGNAPAATNEGTESYRKIMAQGQKADAPLRWVPPKSFDIAAPGLGLPRLEGVEHRKIFDPLPSKADAEAGGSGKYESLRHGLYSHHPYVVLFQDKFIVLWTHHISDENGPGQRILAKVGTFNKDRSDIDWGGDETLVEIAPAPVPVRRRYRDNPSATVCETRVHGNLAVINGKLYSSSRMEATHGWTDDLAYRSAGGSQPVCPATNWSDIRTKRFSFDVFWRLGGYYVQRWRVEGKTIVPDSPLYCREKIMPRVEVTPGRFKDVVQPGEPYSKAPPYAEAPAEFRDEYEKGKWEPSLIPSLKYASGEANRAAADGKNGLAHGWQFRRPDGKLVTVRDNLLDKCAWPDQRFYAALKDGPNDNYPPARRSNLPGSSQPICGELPDGQVWFVARFGREIAQLYLTLSRDGIVFDRTWCIFQREAEGIPATRPPGSAETPGGPAYFKCATVGDNIWIVYSFAKKWMGVTKIPISRLLKQAEGQPAPADTPPAPSGKTNIIDGTIVDQVLTD
jgi:hypothetical protein